MRKPFPVCFFAALLLLLAGGWAAAQQAALTILHTNDAHSHLLPFSYPAVAPPGSPLEGLTVRQNIGGIARRSTLVKRIREEQSRRGIPVWVVDAGDTTDGTPFSTEYRGQADAEAMNALGYDFGTLGNHEFNMPLEPFKKYLGLVRFPLLGANVKEISGGKGLLADSLIRPLGRLKIGLFGIITRETRDYPAAKGNFLFEDEIETAGRMVKALRPKEDIVVAVSHAGEELDQAIARKVEGIDVIIGGHSHSRMPIGEFVWRSEELIADQVNGTVIVQAHQWGGELGRLDLLFSRDKKRTWHVDRFRARLIPVTPDIEEDAAVAAVVDRYWKPIAGRYGEVVGQALDDFAVRGQDLANYNLFADLVREAVGTEIDFENLGGIRAPLIKGSITMADIINADPFDNEVVTFTVTGRQIREILRRTRPAVSGIRYRMENREVVELTINGQPVDETRVYTGSTNSYFAGRSMKGIEVQSTGKMRRETVKEMIRKKGKVKPVYDDRRVILDPGNSNY